MLTFRERVPPNMSNCFELDIGGYINPLGRREIDRDGHRLLKVKLFRSQI